MPSTQLTFVEEIALLALDDASGALRPMPVMAFSYALAGAVLCDLAILNRIDTDPDQLVVINREFTGDLLLDRALARIVNTATPLRVSGWLSLLAEDSRAIETEALDRLVERGILRREEKKILWVFGVRRYPTVDNQERTEVRTRLSELILGDDLPDPRDAILLSLLVASQLADRIFAGPQYNARSERLATLAKMDLVGREVAASIDAVTRALRSAPLAM
jgi:Golgi phosphoprotein 3